MALNVYRVEIVAEFESEVDGVDAIAEQIADTVREHADVRSVSVAP